MAELLCCVFRDGVLDLEVLRRLEDLGINAKRLLACAERLRTRHQG